MPVYGRKFGVFRLRNYRLLLTGQLTSALGDAASAIALPMLVHQKTGSGTLLGLTMACYALPWAIAGSFAGVLADRVDKRRLMIAADLARASIVSVLAAACLTEQAGALLVMVCTFMLGAVGSTFTPAMHGSLVCIIPAGELGQANSYGVMSRQIANLAGPMLALLVISRFGLAMAFWLDAFSFAVSALMVMAMRYRTGATARCEGGRTSILAQLSEGLRTLWSHQVIRWLVVIGLAVNFLCSPLKQVWFPEYAKLGDALDQGLLALMQSGLGLGVLAGSAITGLVLATTAKGKALLGGLGAMGVALLMVGLGHGPAIALAGAAVFGLAQATVNIPLMTLLQKEAPVDQIGRIFGAFDAAILLASPLSLAVAGVAAETFGVHAVLHVVGSVLMLGAIALVAVRPIATAR